MEDNVRISFFNNVIIQISHVVLETKWLISLIFREIFLNEM